LAFFPKMIIELLCSIKREITSGSQRNKLLKNKDLLGIFLYRFFIIFLAFSIVFLYSGSLWCDTDTIIFSLTKEHFYEKQ